MSRTTTTSFNNALDQTVTSVGYLIEVDFGGSPTTFWRWSDLGDQSFNGFTWTSMDFRVRGFQLGMDGFGAQAMSVEIQALDGALISLVLANVAYNAGVRVWRIARDVGSPGDAPQVADMVLDGVDIGLDVVRLRLLPRASRYKYAPSKKCDEANGFSNALPLGTQIAWGSEIYVVGGENG